MTFHYRFFRRLFFLSYLFAFLLVISQQNIEAQTIREAKKNNYSSPTVLLNPASGNAVMISGELWESFAPPNKGPFYREVTFPLKSQIFRIGNHDRLWTTPTHMWPGGWTNGNFWGKNMLFMEYNPDANFNPAVINGTANPAYKSSAGPNYAFGAFNSSVIGANDPTRNYNIETYWTHATRHHAVYEAGWPTNIGVDVKVKIHQFSLNWNHFNDFIIVEITFKNTGVLDINADGVSEKSNNRINALTVLSHGEFMCSYYLTSAGGRSNRFGATRGIGYIGDNDPKGNPWDMMIAYPAESISGMKDMGLNDYPMGLYTEVWSGWSWLAAKDATGNVKNTIYGTHPIGVGDQRGWFTSGGQGRGLSINEASFDPKMMHMAAMSVWYKDGGKSRDASKIDLSPNSKFFLGGTPGNPTTFVPKGDPITEALRPNGDRKLFSLEDASAFEVNTYESDWGKGFTGPENFDGDLYSGIGPFSLEVGEEMTVAWAEVGGYRLRGVTNAMAAARWAYENSYALPDIPTTPEMKVHKPLKKAFRVKWDNRANTHPDFAGYKIYRATQATPVDFFNGGMRSLDDYWKTNVPGPVPQNLLQPVNPNFAAQSLVANKVGVADSWGPYELIAVLPANTLSLYSDNSSPGLQYAYEDNALKGDGKYWYYVAAYTDRLSSPYSLGSTYAGSLDPTTTTLETSNLNRNGASGLWQNTYPFAELNSYYPKDTGGLIAIGAPKLQIDILATRTIGFGTVNIGQKKFLPFSIRNNSDDTLKVSAISSTRASFYPTRTAFQIVPGTSLVDTICFDPIKIGADTAFICLYSNAVPSVDTIKVYGFGQTGTYQPKVAWIRQNDSSNSYSSTPSVATDLLGNVFLAGMTRTGTQNFYTLSKYNPAGELLWTVRYDSSRGSMPGISSCLTDEWGNVYLSGSSTNGLTGGNSDITTMKYNSEGQLLWIRRYNNPALSTSSDYSYAMALDKSGSAIVTGASTLTSKNSEIITLKYSTMGAEEWVARYNGPGNASDSVDISRSLTLDAFGNTYVTGTVASATTMKDIITIKYDKYGVHQWENRYNGPRDSIDEANNIIVDLFGNVYVVGRSVGINTGYDIVLVKYRNDGTQEWVARYDGDAHNHDYGFKLVVDYAGNIYVLGSSYVSDSNLDIVLLKYDASGVRQWIRRYDGPIAGMDWSSGLSIVDGNTIYVCGISMGSIARQEIVLLKYITTGFLDWEARYTSDGNKDYLNTSITVDNAGNVILGAAIKYVFGGYHNIVLKYGDAELPSTSTIIPPPASWYFQNTTGRSASVAVPISSEPQLGTTPLRSGDALGLFFQRSDTLICAGYGVWQEGINLEITVWGDNEQTTQKDGFAENELLRFKIWDGRLGREYPAQVSFGSGPEPLYQSDGIYVLNSCFGILSVAHSIILPQGWNMISSFVAPKDSVLDSLYTKVKSRMVIAKNGLGQVYWPSFNINTIGKWKKYHGYQIYMSAKDTVTITGDEINPQLFPIPMPQGWNLISYLRNSPMRSDSALTSMIGKLVIAKNGLGQVYWPAFTINTIGNMKPGQGYQMYLSSAGILTYPNNASPAPPALLTKIVFAENTLSIPEPTKYRVEYTNTGSNAILIIEGNGVKDGEEIGVWTQENKLAGSGVITNGKGLVTIWGDDEMTEGVKEGMGEDEAIVLTAWSGKERTLKVNTIVNGLTEENEEKGLRYKNNSVWIARVEEAVEAIPTEFALDQNYPNPFNPSTTISYDLPKDVRVTLEVFDFLGRRVTTLVQGEQKAGYYKIAFKGSQLTSGTYFYRIIAGEYQSVKKLLLIK